jgi:hypothetical protein
LAPCGASQSGKKKPARPTLEYHKDVIPYPPHPTVWPMWRGRPRPRTVGSRITPQLIVFATLSLLTPYSLAQRGSAGHGSSGTHSASHSTNSARGSSFNRGGRSGNFRRSSPYLSPYSSLPFPFFGDSFDPDDLYSTGYPVASDPPPYVLQAAREMAGSNGSSNGSFMGSANSFEDRGPSSSQPLMIELQNGRYVRVNGTPADGEAHELAANNNSSNNSSPARKNSSAPLPNSANDSSLVASATPPPPLPPAVLFFRDGRSEEVRDYTIADGTLYARGDFYTDGYWNKKIDLSTLDVTRTEQANAARNVNFILPSSPNEVITRP